MEKLILTSLGGNFQLVQKQGRILNGKEVESYDVNSLDLAEKYVVEINLYRTDFLNGESKYKEVYIMHGMRHCIEPINETLEYIEVLKEAVSFANQVKKYLQEINLYEE